MAKMAHQDQQLQEAPPNARPVVAAVVVPPQQQNPLPLVPPVAHTAHAHTVFALNPSQSVYDWNNMATLAVQRGYYERAAQIFTLTLSRLVHQGRRATASDRSASAAADVTMSDAAACTSPTSTRRDPQGQGQSQDESQEQQVQENSNDPHDQTSAREKEDPLDLVVESAALAEVNRNAGNPDQQEQQQQVPEDHQVMVSVEGMQMVQQDAAAAAAAQQAEEEEERTVYSDPDLRSLSQEELDALLEQDMMEADALEGEPDDSQDFNDEVTLYSAPANSALIAPSSFLQADSILVHHPQLPQQHGANPLGVTYRRFQFYDQSFGTVRYDPEQAETSTGRPLTIAMICYNLAVCLQYQQFARRSVYYRHYRHQYYTSQYINPNSNCPSAPDPRIVSTAQRFYIQALNAIRDYEQAERVATNQALAEIQRLQRDEGMDEQEAQAQGRRLPRMTEDILQLKLAIYNNLGYIHDEWDQHTAATKCFLAMKQLLQDRNNMLRQVHAMQPPPRPRPAHVPIWAMNPVDVTFFTATVQAMDAQERGQSCALSPAA